MKIKELMTPTLETVRPDAPLRNAAQKMKDLNVGALPVCENGRLLGIVTDRDLVVRALATGRNPEKTLVREMMTNNVAFCYEDQDVLEAASLMEQRKLRRIAALNRQHKPVGIVSLGDLALHTKDTQLAGRVLQQISM